jgi:cytochrome P450
MDLGKKEYRMYSKLLNFSNCIGMRFALIEAKLGIAKALRLVEIQKCEKTEVSDLNTSTIFLSSI